MRPGSYLELQHSSAIWGQVMRFNHTTFARLKELSFNDLKADVGEFMSDGEIRDWVNSAKGIVNLVEHLRREKGDGRVFFSNEEIAFDARKKVGRKASNKDLAKFELLLGRKGVKVVYTNAKDPSLKGAVGKTLLAKDGTITVRLARGKGKAPAMGTLVEELVHVNQLQRMGRKMGGLSRLHSALKGRGRKVKAVKASMEAYAKGKVGLVLTSKRDKQRVKRSQRRFNTRVARLVGARTGTTSYWKAALKSRPRSARVVRK